MAANPVTSQGGDSQPDPWAEESTGLLVAGVTGKAIASQTGLGRRTVRRRIQTLMERPGAGTYMQLARQTARRGRLCDDHG
ncbi:helix-turn-helix transcriptional regulator [Streptomyces sp. NPDC050564]|uniref:helix-turn-helix transcriptional regulator n=1 Tax=Streptomyces sp. NPDC050564 TaxID=3365631 RepID=UPI0037B3A585